MKKQWAAVKTAVNMAAVAAEEEQEEEPEEELYEIKQRPEPRYKHQIFRDKAEVMLQPRVWSDVEGQAVEVLPDRKMLAKFLLVRPDHRAAGCHVPQSHSDCNTEKAEMVESAMNHREGGWPKDVKTELMEQKNKFIRKVLKEDMFKYSTTKLGKSMEKVLKQNITLDIEELYFTDVEEAPDHEAKRVKVVAKLKDFSNHRRPVSCLAWCKTPGPPSLAIGHCSPEFLGSLDETCTDAYLADFQNTNSPKAVFTAPSHVTVLDYCDKQSNLLAAGCTSGQVCWWDDRTGRREPEGSTDFLISHRDVVYTMKWVGKTGHEFFTGSQDGYVKWWDIRNFSKPVREFLVTKDEEETDPEKAEGVTSLSFESTMPSKFMLGTAQGSVISCRMQAKAGTSGLMLGCFDYCHRSKVTAVDRNPFYPKNFLTIGDNTAKIWCEDLKTSSIMWMKPSAARLTGGAWNPARMSLFLTTRVDGVLEVWDFLYKQSGPIVPVKVADYPLLTMKIEDRGRLVATGAGDGSTSILQLEEALVNNSKLDRNNASDMFEREVRRERILDNRNKALKVQEKQIAMADKARDALAKEEEATMAKFGCPIKRAEKNFYECLARIRTERAEMARGSQEKDREVPG